MERIKPVRKPSAILISDIHLRDDIPVSRTDDYEDAQWRKLDFISDLQKKYSCVVLHGGDLFHKAKPSPYLLRQAIIHMPKNFYSVMGQHDLVNHQIQLGDKSGILVLEAAGTITILNECHYGQEPKHGSLMIPNMNTDKTILVWHKMAYQTPPYPGATGGNAKHLLQKYPYDLILCGDNHQTFVEEYEGRLLVNPGSMMRMTADQEDHKPCVFLWYAEDNTVQQVFLPIQKDVITREHIAKKEERDERLTAFIEKLDSDYEIGLSFEQNLEAFFGANKVKEDVKQIIYNAIE